MFDRLYEVSEHSQVHFIGFASERSRYDFAIVYTDAFFGKPIIICMQTRKSALLCCDDAKNLEHLQTSFQIDDASDAAELSVFLQTRLPSISNQEQY